MKRGRTADNSIEGGTRLLRAMQVAQPTTDGNIRLEEDEEVRLAVEDVALVTCGESSGIGKVLITTKRVAWLPKTAAHDGSAMYSAGYQLSYPAIAMHAICRDLEAFPEPCIYCQIDVSQAQQDKDEAVGAAQGAYEEGSGSGAHGARDEDMEGGTEELRLVPADANVVTQLFEAMSACAELQGSGDTMMEDDEEGEGEGSPYHILMGGMGMSIGMGMGEGEGEGQWFTEDTTEEDIVAHISAEGQAVLSRLEGMLPDAGAGEGHMESTVSGVGGSHMPSGTGGTGGIPGQFDDAPEA